MNTTGNGLRSKEEILSVFDNLRSQLDDYQDTREKLIKVNTHNSRLDQNLTHRRFPLSSRLGQPRRDKPLEEADLPPPPRHDRGDQEWPGDCQDRAPEVRADRADLRGHEARFGGGPVLATPEGCVSWPSGVRRSPQLRTLPDTQHPYHLGPSPESFI